MIPETKPEIEAMQEKLMLKIMDEAETKSHANAYGVGLAVLYVNLEIKKRKLK